MNLKFIGSKDFLALIKTDIDMLADSQTTEIQDIKDDSTLGFDLVTVSFFLALISATDASINLWNKILAHQKANREKIIIKSSSGSVSISSESNLTPEELLKEVEKIVDPKQ